MRALIVLMNIQIRLKGDSLTRCYDRKHMPTGCEPDIRTSIFNPYFLT